MSSCLQWSAPGWPCRPNLRGPDAARGRRARGARVCDGAAAVGRCGRGGPGCGRGLVGSLVCWWPSWSSSPGRCGWPLEPAIGSLPYSARSWPDSAVLASGQHCSRKARTGGGSLSSWVPSSWWSPNSNLTAGVSLPTRAAASSRLSGHPGGEQLIYLRGGIPGLGEDRARVLAGTGGRAREGGRAPREAW